jgi:nicotinamide-nucleotide amidase
MARAVVDRLEAGGFGNAMEPMGRRQRHQEVLKGVTRTGTGNVGRRWQEGRRFADIAHGRLVELGQTVGVAESLTGGLICSLLTEAPGTSVTFRGGLVVYSTDLKHSIAGVATDDLEKHGPVHSVVAEQLASGARQRLQADYGIGATGVAGPGGQNDRKVGEVFIAVASASGVSAKRYEFDGSRDEIRITTVATALSDLVDALNGAKRSA